MMPPITKMSTFPSVVDDGRGTGVVIDKTDVTVNITAVAVEVNCVTVGCVAVCVGAG